MNVPRGSQLLELARRRPLTPAERAELEAWFAAHPQERPEDWAAELALTRWLASLPPAPLSPRFCENTLAVLDRMERPVRRHRFGWLEGWLVGWRPVWRGAGVAVVLAGLLGLWQHQQHLRERTRLAESIVAITDLTGNLPDVAALAEFDLVLYLPEGPLPDPEALARALE